MPGHPDGQNYAIWRGADFLAATAFPLSNTNPANAQGQVTNFASLEVHVLANPLGGAQVVLQWFTDQTAIVQTFQRVWNLPFGISLDVLVPNSGNFVKASITTTTGAVTNSPIAIFPSNSPAEAARYLTVQNLVEQLAISIPASTTSTFALPAIAGGPGHYYFNDTTGSGHLSFQVITTDITGARIGVLANASAPVTVTFGDLNLPDFPCAVQVTNNDAVAHNASFSLHGLGR